MKKLILILFVGIAVASCVSDAEGTQFLTSTIEAVEMPATYKVDSTSQILIRYKRPDNCHIFNGIFYGVEGYNRNIAIEFARLNQSNCQTDDVIYEVPLNFKPQMPGIYYFKFWHQRDVNGIDQFIEAEAIVPE